MNGDARREWFWLTKGQRGIVDRGQVRGAGIGKGSLEHRLKYGKWRRVHRGVYAAFTGELTREARLWAAVLRAGEGAVLSYETAAEVQGLADKRSSRIHVTVPESRRPAQCKPIPGVVIHRSRNIQAEYLPPWELPRTRIEDTVLDLVAAAATFDDAYDWISRAVSRDKTTAGLLRVAAKERKRMRWRKWLDGALTDIDEGVYFHLEWHYRHDVELAHGLPKGVRQASRVIDGKKHLKDVLYEDHGLCVELDGKLYHSDERVAKDQRRDTINLAVDDVRTLRFGHVDVTSLACKTAALVAAKLGEGGWKGTPRSCSRQGCTVVRDCEALAGERRKREAAEAGSAR
jgi:hypothetical protein